MNDGHYMEISIITPDGARTTLLSVPVTEQDADRYVRDGNNVSVLRQQVISLENRLAAAEGNYATVQAKVMDLIAKVRGDAEGH